MSLGQKPLYYSYLPSNNVWVLTYKDDAMLISILKGVIWDKANGKYIVISPDTMRANEGFITNFGYKLHPNSPIRPDGSPNVATDGSDARRSEVAFKASSAVEQLVATARASSQGGILGSQQNPYQVSDVSTRLVSGVKSIFGNDEIWVSGEISDFSVKDGNCYLTLLEFGGVGAKKYEIKAVVWRSVWTRIVNDFTTEQVEVPKKGDRVCVLCTVDYYDLKTQINLRVLKFDMHYAEAEFFKAKGEIIAKLRKNGLFDLNKALPMHEAPFRLAVFSSHDAAGFDDICKKLRQSNYPFEITLFNIALQGNNVERTFLDAMKLLNQIGEDKFDYALIVRGGGGAADLMWFNNYNIAEAIARSSIRFMVALGHNRDTMMSVLDEMCDSAIVPADAASLLIDRIRLIKQDVEQCESVFLQACHERMRVARDNVAWLGSQLLMQAQRRLDESHNKVERSESDLRKAACDQLMAQKANCLALSRNLHLGVEYRNQLQATRFDNALKEIRMLSHARLDRHKANLTHDAQTLKMRFDMAMQSQTHNLELLADLVRARDPRELLRRGFVCLSNSEGKRLTSDNDVKPDEQIRATLIDGALNLLVKSVLEKKDGKEN